MPHKDPEEARKYFRERARIERKAKPERFLKASRAYYKRNRARIRAAYVPEYHREWRLKRLYGLTLAAWEALFDEQDRKCALCRTSDPRSKKGWCTDHDHETGRVRGILCKSCNTMLGLLGDTSAKAAPFIERIKDYLK